MKWNTFTIKKFLQLYEKYESLYNTNHELYANKSIKRANLEKLLKEVQEQIPHAEDITIEILDKKRKCLKDTYRAEVRKIEKSKRCSSSPDDIIYTPKLEWFQNASFFLPYCVMRDSDGNSDVEVSILTSAYMESSQYEEEIKVPRDENDAFGDYVAEELKHLPPIDQIILRRDIVNLITTFHLEKLARHEKRY